MSRVAKAPINVPDDVEIKLDGQTISVKGKHGQLSRLIHPAVVISYLDKVLTFSPREGFEGGWMQAGTARSLVNQMITGVVKRFTRKLILQGVGYRASIKENVIIFSLGFSHPVEHVLPEGVQAECPTQTEIVLIGIDKQLIGQTAANLRAYRPPESYKGKGVRYDNEVVRIKEAKKK